MDIFTSELLETGGLLVEALEVILTQFLKTIEDSEMVMLQIDILNLIECFKDEIDSLKGGFKKGLLNFNGVLDRIVANVFDRVQAGQIEFLKYKLMCDNIETKIKVFMKKIAKSAGVLSLLIKSFSASFHLMKSKLNTKKPSQINLAVKPILTIIKDNVDPGLSEYFVDGLIDLCVCFENDQKHPNTKIMKTLLDSL